jgi:hypothetical protein
MPSGIFTVVFFGHAPEAAPASKGPLIPIQTTPPSAFSTVQDGASWQLHRERVIRHRVHSSRDLLALPDEGCAMRCSQSFLQLTHH